MSYEEIFESMARPLGELFEEDRRRLESSSYDPDDAQEEYNQIINQLFA